MDLALIRAMLGEAVEDRGRDSETLRQGERRLGAIVQNSSEIMKIVGAEGTLVYANPAFARVFGHEPEQAVASDMNVLDYTHPDDLAKVAEDTQRALESAAAGAEEPPTHTTEYRFRCADGSYRLIEGTATYLLEEPEIEGVVINARDITERKEAERAIKTQQELLAAVTQGAPLMLFALDREGVYTLAQGKAFESMVGEPADRIGRSVFECFSEESGVPGYVRRTLSGEDVLAVVEVEGRSFETRYTPMYDESDAVIGVTGVATDVTERMELQRELEHQAFRDPLTGLSNRRLFEDRLQNALTRCRRSEEPLAVLFMDLDDFKPVNDGNGHDAGDELLIAVAGRLRTALRPEDTICRLGGDEFVVLLEDMDQEAASSVAERIVSTLQEPFMLNQSKRASQVEVRLSTSVGVAVAAPACAYDHPPAKLIREADGAMYRAKQSGKARYELSVLTT